MAHIDCDAFYATVEKRDNPELADRPVIIGGGKRGVVSAACYVSRTYGVRSAMPMFKALALCPQAVVIPPDITKYVRVGREVRHAMLFSLPPKPQVRPVPAPVGGRGTSWHGSTARSPASCRAI